MAASLGLLLGVAVDVCHAQTALPTRWTFSGDVGGAFGGTWLEGPSAPTVSTGTGVGVSLGARRSLGRGAPRDLAAGIAVRVASLPIRLREQGSRWDGGTLTDAQLMGTLNVAIGRSPHRRVDLELGAGMSVLSGANTIYPFSAIGRAVPTIESGLAVFRSRAARTSGRSRPIGLFARYSMTRVDPTPSRLDDVSATAPTAGWVGRIAVGLRVQR